MDGTSARYFALLANLQDEIELLREMIEQAELLHAEVYELPPVMQTHEEDLIEQITVTPVTGLPALARAMGAYRRFSQNPGESTKCPYRLPGALILNGDRDRFTLQVNRINGLKDEIKGLVTALPDKNARFRLVHQRERGIVALQIYRHICLTSEEITSISYTWASKLSSKSYSREAVLALLDSRNGHPPATTCSEEWSGLLARAATDIQRMPPGTRFSSRRRSKIAPMVNYRYPDSFDPGKLNARGQPRRITHRIQQYAHLPLLVIQPSLPSRQSPLTSYSKPAFHQRANLVLDGVNSEWQPLLPGLQLYYAPQKPTSAAD